MKNSMFTKEKISCVLILVVAMSYLVLNGTKPHYFLIKKSNEDIFKNINEITIDLNKNNFESSISSIENLIIEKQDIFDYKTIFDVWENKNISDFSRVVTNIQDNLSHTIDIQDIQIFKSNDEVINVLNEGQKIVLGIGSVLNSEGYEEFKYGKNKIMYNEETNILVFKNKNNILDIQQVPNEFIAYLLPGYIDENEVKQFIDDIENSTYVNEDDIFKLFLYKNVSTVEEERINNIINNINNNLDKFDITGLSFKLEQLIKSIKSMLYMFDEDYTYEGEWYKKNRIRSLISTKNSQINREYIKFIEELISDISVYVEGNYTPEEDYVKLISQYNKESNKYINVFNMPSSYRYIPTYR